MAWDKMNTRLIFVPISCFDFTYYSCYDQTSVQLDPFEDVDIADVIHCHKSPEVGRAMDVSGRISLHSKTLDRGTITLPPLQGQR